MRVTAPIATAAATLLALPAAAATLSTAPFGTTADNKPVLLVTMSNSHGISVQFITYGGIITRIVTPDRNGRAGDIALGFATLHEYETKSAEGNLYFGALIGRYANRIARGRFTLDGHAYTLVPNTPPNTLHGGTRGFDKQVWDMHTQATYGYNVSAALSLVSPAGQEGFPGRLDVTVTYSLDEDDIFTIRYRATTDAPTVLNLTNHTYFNLAGAGSRDGVVNQVLMVDADRYIPTDRTAIPLGQIATVEGTPFDFRAPTAIGARLRADDQQLLWAQGYDHTWVLNKHGAPGEPELAARVSDPASGRTLECLTTEPGVQIYTANGLKGAYAGIGGIFRQTDAFTLETQHFPDSPNRPAFPSTVLKPGRTFDSTTVFKFGVKN